jgi:hypothetical protein
MGVIGWKHLDGGYGNAGMRPERRARSRNGGGRREPPQDRSHSGQKAINPRGLGTESPSKEARFLFSLSEEEWSTTEALSILGIGIFSKERNFYD